MTLYIHRPKRDIAHLDLVSAMFGHSRSISVTPRFAIVDVKHLNDSSESVYSHNVPVV